MRRGFIAGVFAFGAVVATLFAAYLRFGAGQPWPDVLRAWLVILGALTVAPLFGARPLVAIAFLSPAAWGWLVGRMERRGGHGAGPTSK
jgi:hypothetical protein